MKAHARGPDTQKPSSSGDVDCDAEQRQHSWATGAGPTYAANLHIEANVLPRGRGRRGRCSRGQWAQKYARIEADMLRRVSIAYSREVEIKVFVPLCVGKSKL